MHVTIKKGLDLPIAGLPEQVIEKGNAAQSVAILGDDYVGMKPTMLVKEGQAVKLGEALFTDKKIPGVIFTSPAAGTVKAINRGNKRVLQSVVIELAGDDEITFKQYDKAALTKLTREEVKQNLIAAGLWTALRTRPYSKSPHPDSHPHSIFVTATDSHPLAANPNVVIDRYYDDYLHGLTVLTALTDGKVMVCQTKDATLKSPPNDRISIHTFSGLHPAGLAGTHIHFIDPVGTKKTVWHLNYQDTIAIGKLFTTGRLWTERIIALAGPLVTKPRLICTRLGANTDDLLQNEVQNLPYRAISGSVLHGHTAAHWAAFIGRFHQQVSVIAEHKVREPFGWIRPGGANKFSVLNLFISKLLNKKNLALTTSQNGSPRAMVPAGAFEMVMPLDVLPTQLLRALVVKDTDAAQALGCLELDEEDLALCSFACSGKFDYGPMLRINLDQIEKEG